MHRRIRFVAMVAILTLVPALRASASHVGTIVRFDPTKGEFPEGIAADKRGNLFVSVTPLGQIRKIAPDGTQTVVATLNPGPGLGPAGLAVDAPGNVYATLVSFDPATQGVYKIATDGTVERLPGTGAIQLPNGLAFDDRGNLFVTDSILGAVWRIPRGGSAELWIQHPLLAGDGSAGFGFPIGANGIAYRHGEVFVGMSEKARIARIPVLGDGSAGTPVVLAEGPALFGIDGMTLDVHGDIWAAIIVQSKLVKVSAADGSVTTMATAADGLDWASSLVFGTGRGDRQAIFMVNFAIGPPGGPGPGVLRVEAGVPGLPMP